MTDHAIPPQDPDEIFQQLAQVSPRAMADYFRTELPQTAAAVLLLITPAAAAEILNALPPRFRRVALRCMARTRPMQSSAKALVAEVLAIDMLTATPIPPDREEEVRRIIGLMAPQLREEAQAALDDLPEVLPFVETTVEPVLEGKPVTKRFPYSPGAPLWGKPPQHEMEFERLPMLETIYDLLARRMSTSLLRLVGNNVEISLECIRSIRHDDYIDNIPLPAIMSVFRSEALDHSGVLIADPALLESVVEAMLGGTAGIDAPTPHPRRFTTIEATLFKLMATSILSDLSTAFTTAVSPAEFSFDRLESNPRFALIAPTTDPMVVARLRIDIGGHGRGGRFDLLTPYALFDSVMDLMRQTIRPSGKPRLVAG